MANLSDLLGPSGMATLTGTQTLQNKTLTNQGDITFAGIGRRIRALFSTATALVDRLLFQSDTTNGSTDITAVPNGTSNRAGFMAINASDTTNHGFFALLALLTDMRLWSGKNGSGTVLPLTFFTDATERMRISADGRIQKKGPEDSDAIAVAALNIDCSLGNYFTKTIAGNSTFTVSSVPTGRVFGFTLELTHTSGTVTWFSGVQWPNNSAPTLVTGKVHLFTFVTDDGGTTWRGSYLPNYNA